MHTVTVTKQNSMTKIVGLLGKKVAQPIYFTTRFGIHTFGLFFSIDVIILDKHRRIKKLKHQLQPNKIFLWNPKYKHVVELPSGFIEEKNMMIGDQIQLVIK